MCVTCGPFAVILCIFFLAYHWLCLKVASFVGTRAILSARFLLSYLMGHHRVFESL